MKKTCIICPVGCELEITKQGDEYIVTGNNCLRGSEYGKSEMIAPKRVVTAIIYGQNQICSVKTDKPVDKDKINELLCFLNNAPKQTYKIGDVVFKNPLNLDCNVIITGTESY